MAFFVKLDQAALGIQADAVTEAPTKYRLPIGSPAFPTIDLGLFDGPSYTGKALSQRQRVGKNFHDMPSIEFEPRGDNAFRTALIATLGPQEGAPIQLDGMMTVIYSGAGASGKLVKSGTSLVISEGDPGAEVLTATIDLTVQTTATLLKAAIDAEAGWDAEIIWGAGTAVTSAMPDIAAIQCKDRPAPLILGGTATAFYAHKIPFDTSDVIRPSLTLLTFSVGTWRKYIGSQVGVLNVTADFGNQVKGTASFNMLGIEAGADPSLDLEPGSHFVFAGSFSHFRDVSGRLGARSMTINIDRSPLGDQTGGQTRLEREQMLHDETTIEVGFTVEAIANDDPLTLTSEIRIPLQHRFKGGDFNNTTNVGTFLVFDMNTKGTIAYSDNTVADSAYTGTVDGENPDGLLYGSPFTAYLVDKYSGVIEE
jgi:hypothetical protein